MVRCKDFAGWTYAECKNCGKVFPFEDKNGDYNEIPPTKFYCPQCEKLGFKNKKGKETPEEFLKANNITDKDVIREFKNGIKNFRGKRLNFNNILKDALEIVEYKTRRKNGNKKI